MSTVQESPSKSKNQSDGQVVMNHVLSPSEEKPPFSIINPAQAAPPEPMPVVETFVKPAVVPVQTW